MHLEPIPENSKRIVDTMRDLIARGMTKHSNKTTSGWRYEGHEGDDFTKAVNMLHESMQAELRTKGFQVVGCTVRHFFRGAYIQNPNYPTKQVIIIPLNGISTLSGCELPPNTCCYVEDTPTSPTLSGEGIDVIFVALEAENKGQ